MKMCDICHQRIAPPYSRIIFTIPIHEPDPEWDFCDKHAEMIKGFLWNLKREVLGMIENEKSKNKTPNNP